MTTNKPQIEAYLVNRIKGQGYGKPRKILDAEVYDPTSDSFFAKGAKEKYTVEPLVPLSKYKDLQAECEKLRKDAERLKARVAKLEGEDTLWAMLDAIEKALFRKAAPHAWESVVTSAGSNFIVSRRKSKEPANEGDRHA